MWFDNRLQPAAKFGMEQIWFGLPLNRLCEAVMKVYRDWQLRELDVMFLLLYALPAFWFTLFGLLTYGFIGCCLAFARGGRPQFRMLFRWFAGIAHIKCAGGALWWVWGLSVMWLLVPGLIANYVMQQIMWGMTKLPEFGDLTVLPVVGGLAILGVWLICCAPVLPRIYSYKLVPWVVQDDPQVSAREAVARSTRLMQGVRWQFAWLQLRCWWVIWLLTMIFSSSWIYVLNFLILERQGNAVAWPMPLYLMYALGAFLFVASLIVIPWYHVAVSKFYDARRAEVGGESNK